MANEVRIRVTADDATGPAFDSARHRSSGLGGALGGLKSNYAAVAGAAAGAAIALEGTRRVVAGMISAASALDEAQNKVNVVFGASAPIISEFAKTSADTLGQSSVQALAAAGTFGNLFTAMKIGQAESATMSTKLVTLASDLASFNDIDPGEALEKLRAGLVGEAEPLRTLGVQLSAARVEAKAMEMGLVDATGAISDAGKVAARFAIIMDDTSVAQGDFARTSDGLANTQRILAANISDLQARIGVVLLPAVTALTSAMIDLIDKTDGMGESFETLGMIIGGVVSAIRPLTSASLNLFDRWNDLGEAAGGLIFHQDALYKSMDATTYAAAEASREFGVAAHESVGYAQSAGHADAASSKLSHTLRTMSAAALAAAVAEQILAISTDEAGNGIEIQNGRIESQLRLLRGMVEHGEAVAATAGALISAFSTQEEATESVSSATKVATAALSDYDRQMSASASRSEALAHQFASLGDAIKGQLDKTTLDLMKEGVSPAVAVQVASSQAAGETRRRTDQILEALALGTLDYATSQRALNALRAGSPDPVLESLGLATVGSGPGFPTTITVKIGEKSFEDAVVSATTKAAAGGR